MLFVELETFLSNIVDTEQGENDSDCFMVSYECMNVKSYKDRVGGSGDASSIFIFSLFGSFSKCLYIFFYIYN